ncbi:HmuY family protein [Sphingobacterium oryzagri]|uniref:HmuY family protein n=1 Tax=Sphingobacterium oryzagri TaxID=3025669 RepID=A0ABY7WLW2_9SPHI|nr:HmuY family protein [Sphingobacterium sp. KACC 22765]WDF69642.1 HmuY family protein [Sphingobacterium sp. KACC 22765]
MRLKTTLNKNKAIRLLVTCSFALFVLSLTACADKGEPVEPVPVLPELPAITVTSSGTYSVTNLPGDTTQTMAGQAVTSDGNFQTIYYSLEDGRAIPKEYAATDKWDIAFAGIYNSSIWANHGEIQFEDGTKGPGFGSTGRGGLYLVVDSEVDSKYYNSNTHKPNVLPIPFTYLDEAYNKITEVPAAAQAQLLSNGYLNLDHFLGSGNGYAFYDFYGTMYPGNSKKAHVVYNMARPIIIKTAKGNWAKIIIYSFYKNKPEDPDRDHQAPFISFQYTILKDKSTNFNTIAP